MAARSKARKRAVDVLYESDLRGTSAVETLADRLKQADPPVPEYAVTLVEGVVARRTRIDELLETYAQDWTLDRFPAVDLAGVGGVQDVQGTLARLGPGGHSRRSFDSDGSAVDPAEVSAVAGVDLDPVAGVEEQRHLDLRAGLQRRRLRAAGGPVSLQARVRV